ncbi:MAG: hypothetical protein ACJAZ8_001070 [Planctomycetota bacterium]|jgi:hypothetical protein
MRVEPSPCKSQGSRARAAGLDEGLLNHWITPGATASQALGTALGKRRTKSAGASAREPGKCSAESHAMGLGTRGPMPHDPAWATPDLRIILAPFRSRNLENPASRCGDQHSARSKVTRTRHFGASSLDYGHTAQPRSKTHSCDPSTRFVSKKTGIQESDTDNNTNIPTRLHP